jgi:hypothetical protein
MARYAIRGLDMAGDTTEGLVEFLMAAQIHDVTVRFTRACGPGGYPVATFYSFNLEDMTQVLLEYCGGDHRAMADYMEMVERVAD